MEDETKITDAEFTEVQADVPAKEPSEDVVNGAEVPANDEAPATLGVNVDENTDIGDRMA